MPSHRSGGGQLSTGTSVPSRKGQRQITHAPDGGSIAEYPRGYRFLPSDLTFDEREQMKNIPRVVEAMKELHGTEVTPVQYAGGGGGRKAYRVDMGAKKAKYHKVIADAHYEVILAPRIKAQQQQRDQTEEEQRQAMATLKMRVQELEKPTPEPTPEPTPTTPVSTISILPIIIVAVALIGILLFLRRRA